jgi:hypothetical protein
MAATALSPTLTDNTLFGHPPGSTTPPNKTETFPSPWPWYVYSIGALVIILVILTCIAVSFGLYKYLSQRRVANIEATPGKQARTRNNTATNASRILQRDTSSFKTVTLQPPREPAEQIWDVNNELYESGSSWRINTITAWVNDIPEDAGLDSANLEIQLWRARRYEELWIVGGRILEKPKATFAWDLPTREHVMVHIDKNYS